MEAAQKKQNTLIPSREAVAECLSDALGEKITFQDYPKLFPAIAKIFENYWEQKEGRTNLEGIELLDNAIMALQRVKSLYLAFPEIDPIDLKEAFWEKLLLGKESIRTFTDSKERKIGERKIKPLLRDLRNVREGYLAALLSIHPQLGLPYKDPEGWLIWALTELLGTSFPRGVAYNYQIDNAIYSLLLLHEVEIKKESRNPAKMISRRSKRYLEKLERELSTYTLPYPLPEEKK